MRQRLNLTLHRTAARRLFPDRIALCAAGELQRSANQMARMPNGRGTLECCYCEHYRCHNPDWAGYDAAHEAGECLRHRISLPATTDTGLQRVCRDFQPNEWFGRDSAATAEERLAFFPQPLAPGILFGFSYCWPPNVRSIAALAHGLTEGPKAAEPGAAPDTAG